MSRRKSDPRQVKIICDGERRTTWSVNELGVGHLTSGPAVVPLDEIRRCYAGVPYPVEIIERPIGGTL